MTSMKTIVLDANELSRDWLCTGLKYQLLEHMFHATWLNVCIPAVVLEEVIANHGRSVEQVEWATTSNQRARRRLGLDEGAMAVKMTFDYREYITDRLVERLGFTVLPWPEVPHKWLIERAVGHLPPFNAKGSGYRDALIWSDVIALAKAGHAVALVSADRVFGDAEGTLAEVLKRDVEETGGQVELVRDFGAWLLDQLPWKAANLSNAVSESRDAMFYDWYLKSDFQDDLRPEVEDLGFDSPPSEVVIEEVAWDGDLRTVSEAVGPGNLALVEYAIGQSVRFAAVFDRLIDAEPSWQVTRRSGGCEVTGNIAMVVRAAVLFGGEFGFSVEELAWQRSDGRGPGPSCCRPDDDPDQLALM